MPLLSGVRLGIYEVVELIGMGGMGEVYRARDARLNRDVAIKILPSHVAADLDRLARFRREAQVLASLNHFNIGSIYGFEESGGVQALILELVDGPTLADRIAREPVPLDEAVQIAVQIGHALEAAHERGIVHRDLKPANIKVRSDGTVKLLDFGLAKALANDAAAPETLATITSPALTRFGVILGTAAYMSPEQARGREADRRSDIWAFGCVLYEMLTAKRAFDGSEVSDTLATILKSDPDWTALPQETPSGIRRVLRRCLEKDPSRRFHDMADVRLEIEEPPALEIATVSPLKSRLHARAAWTVAGVSLGLLGALAGYVMLKPAATPRDCIASRTEEAPPCRLRRSPLRVPPQTRACLSFCQTDGLFSTGALTRAKAVVSTSPRW
jgi:serine/threonine protein kinase